MTTPYVEQFEAFAASGAKDGPSWLPALRKKAFERFTALGFPTTRDEDWHFTSVTPIAERTFKAIKPAPTALTLSDIEPYLVDAEWHRLVFVNGRLEPSLSQFAGLPADVQLAPLSEVLKEEPEWAEKHLGSLAAFDKAAFTAMNTAFMQDGVVLRVPKGEVIDTPIHILHVTDANAAGAAIHPRLLVVAEPLAQAMLVEQYVGLGAVSYLVNAVAEIVVGNGARVDHYKVQNESTEAFHVGTAQVTQGRDSIYHSFSFAAGAALSRTNVYTKLADSNSEGRLNGLYLLDGSQHGDHQTFVEHLAESCASRELYCGVLDGQSHGVFNGKVYVDPIAQKTDGKQTNKALLLSPQARVDTKPQLEIFADDVKCTHGATVGRIDEMALFYLKSRGIGGESARALLTYAFAAEALETIEIDALRLSLERQVFERFTHTQLV
ncbi:MAG TPA: Fe-S cluster assembly protein SufD [Gemmatimonadaceae bacterium]|nr:Fe-S cluster assembly protein SufD [Gemmatimonadaceae bacterium]HRQ77984.1 Fe-S cluster assembly protein SufD [Gemmatimonadaceae bacterium]